MVSPATRRGRPLRRDAYSLSADHSTLYLHLPPFGPFPYYYQVYHPQRGHGYAARTYRTIWKRHYILGAIAFTSTKVGHVKL